MIRPIGFSVGTQALTSAGNFIITLLIVRFVSVESFGYYVNVFAVASIASATTMSLTGSVYTFSLPKYALMRKSYEKNYNGFNLLVTVLTTVLASAAAAQLLKSSEWLAGLAVPLFILSFICLDNLRLQASANGQHAVMFSVELARQTTLILILILMNWKGSLQVSAVMLAQGLTGLLACVILLFSFGAGLSFARFAWLARRHIAYGRFLLPATVIGTFNSSGIQLIVGRQFGFEATGILRLAELPFSALNPLKQSLAYFLPRIIHQFERDETDRKPELLLKYAIAFAVGTVAIILCAWIAAVYLIPIVTGKQYPVWIGLIYGVAFVFIILVAPLQIYLNALNKPNAILNQTIVGSVVSLAAYFATCASLGPTAAAVAGAACYLSMLVHGAVVLSGHVNAEKQECAQTSSSDTVVKFSAHP